MFLAGCEDGGEKNADTDSGADTETDTENLPPNDPVSLIGAPLLYAPTSGGATINVVAENGRERLELAVRKNESDEWSYVDNPVLVGDDAIEWKVHGLEQGTVYEYLLTSDNPAYEIFSGELVTAAKAGVSFTFDVLTDTHIFARDFTDEEIAKHPNTWIDQETAIGQKEFAIDTLSRVASNIEGDLPDFVIHLGDLVDFHGFGFNDPPPDGTWARKAYMEYRKLLGETLGNMHHFLVIGNWEGENGDYSEAEFEICRPQRLIYMPGPEPTTYPEGGSVDEDYYAFTWGDALFIVLNVMGYTTEPHLLSGPIGEPDDWTLGDDQILWLEETLQNSASKWNLIFIHHTVGGEAGTDDNSAYGRGGGQAAYVGEQKLVHDLMIKHGVQIFFYGHDHVFTDMVVDGIHYTLPGSAGAPWKFGTTETGYEAGTYRTDSGHARVNVSQDAVKVELIDVNGNVIDQFEVVQKL